MFANSEAARAGTKRLLLDAAERPRKNLHGTEEESAPRAMSITPPRELPPDTFGFIGRRDQLENLDRLLEPMPQQSAGAVVSTLSGTAGVGKTALAVHWAHRVSHRFPDGQLYVDLRGYDAARTMPPTEALDTFLRGLGVAGEDIPAEQVDRATRFRSLLADRRMLILLDNARNVDQVRDLLPGTSTSVALVTSRDTLAGLAVRHGPHRIELDRLPAREAVALLRTHVGDRADTEPDIAAGLAEQCARLPLALRIAAQVAVTRPALGLAELVTKLADERARLTILDAGDPYSSAARAVFSWSYRYLPASAARLFRLLGTQPAETVDRYAAAALADVDLDEARRLLTILTRAHLVRENNSGRYGMHDLLRSYAKEQARTHDSEDVRRAALTRLLDYYVETAAVAAVLVAPYERNRCAGTPDQVRVRPRFTERRVALAWLDTERPHLVAATLYAADHGWPTHTEQLSNILFRYLDIGAHHSDSELVHSAALRVVDAATRARALGDYGVVLWRSGRHQQALCQYLVAHAVSREVGDHVEALPMGETDVLNNMGTTLRELGSPLEAVKCHEQALACADEVGDRYEQARAHDGLASCRRDLGDLGAARMHWRTARAVHLALGTPEAEQIAGELQKLDPA